MRTLIALLTVGVMLVSTAARATPSRAVALGDLGLYVDDDTNVFRYPALIGKYTQFVFVDLTGPSGLQPALTDTQRGGLNGGAFINVGEGVSVGVVASDFAPGASTAFMRQVANASLENEAVFLSLVPAMALRRYDLIFGYEASKDFAAGLRLAYGSNSETYVPDKNAKVTQTDPDVKPGDRLADRKSQTQFQMTAGISGTINDGASYDLAFDYGHFGFGYDKNEDYAFLASGHEIGLSARARFIVSRFWDIVPQVAYRGTFFNLKEDGFVPAFGDASSDEFQFFPGDGVREHARSNHTVDVGAAGVMRASHNVNFWVASGILYKSTNIWMNANKVAPLAEMEETTSLYSLPYIRFAVEAAPLQWLQLRVGVEKYTWQASSTSYMKDKEAEKEFTEGQSGSLSAGDQADFSTYVGASFLLEGFQLDLLLDQDFFKRGPSFLSGAQGNLAGRASLSYRF